MMTRRLCTALAASAMLWASGAGAAEYRADYTITALGLTIASTSFQTRIDGDRYAIDGSLRSAGIARLFTTTDGSLSARGTMRPGTITPHSFDVRYTDNKKAKRTTIGFTGNRVTDFSNSPVIRKGDDWIEVARDHLVGVLDPVTASMLPASSPGEVCRNTMRVFDGAMRSELKLSYLRTIPFSAKGYTGDAVTCTARFVPVSGYPRNKREITWMRDNGRIEISFAPVGTTGFYAPVRARVRVEAATINVTATRFEQVAE